MKFCYREKISNFIKENFAENINYFENKNKIKIEIISDNSLTVTDYLIDFQNKSKKTIEKLESLTQLKKTEVSNNEIKNIKNKNKNKKFKKKKYYKKKYYKKNN